MRMQYSGNNKGMRKTVFYAVCSGHNKRMRKTVINSGLSTYKNMEENQARGNTPLHRKEYGRR